MRTTDINPAVGDLQAQGVGEVFGTGLGGVVSGQPGGGGERRQRGHHQHITAAFDDGGQGGPDRVEHADDVDVYDAAERLGIDLQHRTEAGDPGVGDHDVDAAESVHRGIGRPLHGGQVTNVGQGGQYVRRPAEFLGQFRQRRLVQIGEHQPGALATQSAGHFGTHTARSPGDEDDLAVQ